MNVCIIGDSLTSLVLAKNLINKKIKVFLYYEKKGKQKSITRTIGVSKDNLSYINKEIIKIKKQIAWNINKIEIYTEKNKSEKIIEFDKSELKEGLFSIIKNSKIYEILKMDLKKRSLFKKIHIKNETYYKKILNESKYDLIINCDTKNQISKKLFDKKTFKDYNSEAYTTIIKHKPVTNRKAIQFFTKLGPIAFLPISKIQTSIVFSRNNSKKSVKKNEIKNFIKEYNNFYKIISFEKFEKFKLSLSVSKIYYKKKVLAFGDNLHRIHPLAGQGFNMTLRDIKTLSSIIQNRIDLGLNLDETIYYDFEKKSKHLNFLYSTGIDFIHEFFKLNFIQKINLPNNLIKLVGKNKTVNNLFQKYANYGFKI